VRASARGRARRAGGGRLPGWRSRGSHLHGPDRRLAAAQHEGPQLEDALEHRRNLSFVRLDLAPRAHHARERPVTDAQLALRRPGRGRLQARVDLREGVPDDLALGDVEH